MPITENDTKVFEYPMPKRGVNLYSSVIDLSAEECFITQNCFFRNGLVKRGGQRKVSAAEVNAGNKITGLYRFYKSDGTRQLIASSDTDVRFDDSGTWDAISTGQTADLQTNMVTWLNEVYVANGTDDPFKWDGSTKTQFSTFSSSNIPTDAVQFLPYQDRLLVIESANPGDLRWSASYADGEASSKNWETIANAGVRPDNKLHGMITHVANDANTGIESKVLLAGANGMYLFSGTDLRTPFTTGNYTVTKLAGNVGCNAPRTMAWTPFGTIYLGTDRQVYILEFNSVTPVPIGTKIRSTNVLEEGLESMPTAQITNACAIYHDGFYKISFAGTGETTNKRQWWLDITRISRDENQLWGPWYGPMKGQTISVFANQAGSGDGGELMAGENTDSIGSFVYEVGNTSFFGDGQNVGGTTGTAIQVFYQTFYHPLGTTFLNKVINRIEATIRDVVGTVNIDFQDVNQSLRSGDAFALSDNAVYWNDLFWDEFFWSNSSATRIELQLGAPITARRLSMLIKFNSSDDLFELYGLRVETKEQGSIFL